MSHCHAPPAETARLCRIRLLVAIAGLGLLSACAGVDTPRPAPPSRPAPAPAPPSPRAHPPAPPPPPPPVVMSEAEVRSAIDDARNLLDLGDEAQASAQLQRVLQADPGQRVASALYRQVTEDPVKLLGRESFAYRVQSGDTLGGIAQRMLDDRDAFYALARYNGIRVPRQLQVGQVIRVPGKGPPPKAAPAPASATTSAPEPPPAANAESEPASPAASAAAPEVDAAAQARQTKAAVDRWSRQARAAMARQDLCGSIHGWDEVLALDPENRTAQLERDKALDLKKRLSPKGC